VGVVNRIEKNVDIFYRYCILIEKIILTGLIWNGLWIQLGLNGKIQGKERLL